MNKIGRFLLVLFMINTYVLGFYYNNLLRVGNLFPSDIVLVFIIIWIIGGHARKLVINKKIIIAFSAAFIELFLGLLFLNKISNIYRDFKIFLYFIIPYQFFKMICKDKRGVETLFKTYLVVIVVSIGLNLYLFFTKGIQNIESGELLRTFAVGLGWGAVIPIFLVVGSYKTVFIKEYSSIRYWFLQMGALICIVLSNTRTLWITFIITYILKMIFVDNVIKKVSVKRLCSVVCSTLIITSLLITLNKLENPIYAIISERFLEIGVEIKDDDSTLAYRINDISSSFYKLQSPRIILGYGYGDTREPYGYRAFEASEENGCENSFFYYLWKYGIVITFILFSIVLKKLINLYSGNKGQKIFAIYLLVSMLIGSMSGHLNNSYSLCNYALYFCLANNISEGLKLFKLEN